MTTDSALRWAAESLAEAGVEDARLNAELLLCHLLGVKRGSLLLQRHHTLSFDLDREYRSLIGRRKTREPLQYILGEVEFMGLKLEVNRDVLIPRPETEVLVEKALGLLRVSDRRPLTVLDIGTGSGNIAIALGHFRPDLHITAIDSSPAALRVALRNRERHRVSCATFEQADLFDEFLPGRRFDMIVSNPPYVPALEFDTLQPEIRLFEPPVATTDGGDGLRMIRRILEIAPGRLDAGGFVVIELGDNQSLESAGIARGCGLVDVEVYPDLAGIQRVLVARKSGI
jgi:release factor glutamine methyltransferase